MDDPITNDSTELQPRLRHPQPSTSSSSSPARVVSAPPPRSSITTAFSLPSSPNRSTMGPVASTSAAAAPPPPPPRASVHSADVFVMEQTEHANHFVDPTAFEGMPFWDERQSAGSDIQLPRPYYPPQKPKGLFSGQKGFVIVVLLVFIVFVVGLIVGLSLKKRCHSRMVVMVPTTHDYNPKLSKFMQGKVDPEQMRLEMQFFANSTHQAGTKNNRALAEHIYAAWYNLHFDKLFFDNYTVQLSTAPKANTVVLRHATSGAEVFRALSSERKEGGVFPYNAFSPNGSAKGEFIFVNYGSSSDLRSLEQMNVTLKGRLAVARIGAGYRAGIAKRCAAAGAIGLVIYADPADFALDEARIFPKGWWLPGDAPVFGNMRTHGGGGDPLTPDLPAVPGTYSSKRSDNSTIEFATIPVQSVGYDDAKAILDHLRGPAVPSKWKKSLGKRVGPAQDIHLHLQTHNQLVTRRIQNVIAVVRGDPEYDRLVVIGNHYDAWIHGAHDPISGTVIVQQVSKLFIKETRRAYRPRRTLVFAAWDAEEMGTVGSTEFTERLALRLSAQAVAYVNLDCPVKGNYSFFARTSPLLRGVVEAAAGAVRMTPQGPTLLEDWRRKLPADRTNATSGPEQPLLGGGSDQGAFLFKLGVPSTYPQYMYNGRIPNVPEYHTKYDVYRLMAEVIDPGFSRHDLVAKAVIDLVLRLADSALLPLQLEQYPFEMLRFAKSIEQDKERYAPLADGSIDLKILFSAIQHLNNAVKSFSAKARRLNATDALALRIANDAIMAVPRAFLWSEGLPSRPYYKNVLLSPALSNSYGGSFLTGFRDGLTLGNKSQDWGPAFRHFSVLVNAVRGAALLLRGAFV